MRKISQMKFNRHSIRLLVSIIVIFTVGHAYGEQQWWEKSNEGWFFYNEKPVIEEPEATPVLPSGCTAPASCSTAPMP